jgi:hypothetical protein
MRGLRLLGLSAAILNAVPAWCSQSSTGTVTFYSSAAQSIGFLTSGTRTALPSCATDTLWVTPEAGGNDVLIASILSLIAQGKPFAVYGTGTCENGRELISFISANP